MKIQNTSIIKHINNFEEFVRNISKARGAFNGDRYLSKNISNNLYVDEILYSENLCNEGTAFDEVETNKLGGIITFYTVVNSNELSQNKFINTLKQKLSSLVKKVTAMNRIDSVADKYQLEGWTVTKALHGRYKDRKTGVVFDENSLSVELVGIDEECLINVAQELSNIFNQQSVLVKSYISGDIMFVYPNE